MAAFTDSPEKKTLLIVDDTIPNRLLLRQALSGDYEILEAGDGQTALEILRAAPEISLIILDILMPASDGYGVLEALRADEELRKLPVVVIAGEDMDSQIRAFELGAADVMIKPFNPQIILHRVRNLISRVESESLAEQNREYERAMREAQYDKLTGIFSRTGFYARVRALLDGSEPGAFVLIRFDLDRFKAFNDTFAARRATRCWPPWAICCARGRTTAAFSAVSRPTISPGCSLRRIIWRCGPTWPSAAGWIPTPLNFLSTPARVCSASRIGPCPCR